MSYLVLIPCRNDKSGLAWQPGDIVHDGELPPDVIDNWLHIEPPVLAIVAAVDEEE